MTGVRRLVVNQVRLLTGLVTGLCAWQSAAAGILLYDDSTSQRPGDQAWLAYASDGFLTGGTATQTIVPGVGVTLATDDAVSAGYSNRTPFGLLKNAAFPELNRSQGFAVDFQLRVNSESHNSPNRAGFSVILLSSDSRGIELGFWEDQIWAQADSPLFTHAESVSFNTTTAEVAYQLTVQGNSYFLAGNNSLLLTGGLRDYSSFGSPYSLPNFLFLGDNTSSAGANVTLGSISLSAVPEPAVRGLMSIVAAASCVIRRRQRVSDRAARVCST